MRGMPRGDEGGHGGTRRAKLSHLLVDHVKM